MQIDTDLLLIITSTAEELSGGTNIVVVIIAAYRWIYWLRLIGLVQRLAATWRCMLHSSDEPSELSQWLSSGWVTVCGQVNHLGILNDLKPQNMGFK